LNEEEVQPVVAFLIGNVFSEADSRVLEIGGQTLYKMFDDKKQMTLLHKPLTILDVKKIFEDIARSSGKGSKSKKEGLLQSLLIDLLNDSGVIKHHFINDHF
jgi:ATP-dependent DNA ligase